MPALLSDTGSGSTDKLDIVSTSAGKIFGMENFGNTCYCNSIVQCLYYSKPFREHVLSFPGTPSESAATWHKRSTVSGVTPHPFTVDPTTAKISTSTGSPEATQAQTAAAIAMANQARSNGYDHTNLITTPGAGDKKQASESKSLGRRMSLFGKSNGKANAKTVTSAATDGAVSTAENQESADLPGESDNANKLAEVMNSIFESNSQTTYSNSKMLYPGLKGLHLGVRYPGQNIPVVGFTEDPFATQETRKRTALVKGPIINLDLSYADRYNMKESLFTTLKDIFECMAENNSRIGVVSPSKLIEVLKRENELFRSSMHQDAHEFLNFMLNEVIENIDRQNRVIESSNGVDVNEFPSSGTATPTSGSRWVHDLFEGLLTSETKCLTCDTVSRRDEQFLDLSIDIERNSSVTACLRQFSASEMLCERNKFNCDHCGGLHEAEKRMKVKKLPKILALHLKRFKYTEDLQRNVKLFHRVVYPEHLRLDNTTQDAQDKDKLYELYAIVVHIGGGPYHGHYVSIIKTETAGWLLFDDEMVEGVDPTYVFNFFGDNKGLATAYVLFYQEISQEQYERDNLYTNNVPPATGTNSVPTAVATAVPSVNPSTVGLSTATDIPPVPHLPTPVSRTPTGAHAGLSPHSTGMEPSEPISIPVHEAAAHGDHTLASPQGPQSVSPGQTMSSSLFVPKRPDSSEPVEGNAESKHQPQQQGGLRMKTSASSGALQFWKKKDSSKEPKEPKEESATAPVEPLAAEVPQDTPLAVDTQTPAQKKKSRHLSFGFKKH